MERSIDLASCLVHNGTVSGPRDMIRALETVEGLTYRQMLDGEKVAEGRATLVKLMAEPGASTILVNGCLFLNVLSFRYLNFETDSEGAVLFRLVADDGMRLELVPVEEEDEATAAPNPRAARLMEAESFDPDAYAMLDDDDEDDAR